MFRYLNAMELNEIVGLTLGEVELVEQAARGDFSAFEELIQLYKAGLWKFVYRLLNNSEDANDVIQQVLIQVYRGLPGLENPTRFRSWLFMIARNKCLDHLRKRPSLPFSSEVIEQRETQLLLREAIEQLADKPKQVVLLRYSTDLSFAEIGDALGINENTVKTLFRRAKDQLRDYIKQRL